MQGRPGRALRTAPADHPAWRWLFLVLSFAITMIGYADRQFLALLKPALDHNFHWSPTDYGWMTTGFQLAIAVSLLAAGGFLDRAGLRWGFAAGLGGWSVAAALHAAARTVPQFIAARVALGVFESVGTPAAMKSLATFFAPDERALAIGISNMAPNLAAIITPLAVTALYGAVGWQATILCVAAAGFFCLALWLALPFRRMAQVPLEAPGAGGASLAGWSAWRDRNAWVLAGAKLLTDQGWWFMLFWLPDFLHRRFALDMHHLGAPVAAIYSMAAAGALLGGVAPKLIHARFSMRYVQARWLTMGLFALFVTPIAALGSVDSLWGAVLIAGLALACHQGFATNIFAIAAGLFPASRIASAVGFAAFAGNVSGAASAQLAGLLLQHYGTVTPMFFLCAGGYAAAWVLLRVCLP